jgi:hypothetical protein
MDGRLVKKAEYCRREQDNRPKITIRGLFFRTCNVENVDKASCEKVDRKIKPYKEMLRLPACVIYQLLGKAPKEKQSHWNHIDRNCPNSCGIG